MFGLCNTWQAWNHSKLRLCRRGTLEKLRNTGRRGSPVKATEDRREIFKLRR
nr:MAG TPA: hypothetical protein [Caudoviricetes sp.]